MFRKLVEISTHACALSSPSAFKLYDFILHRFWKICLVTQLLLIGFPLPKNLKSGTYAAFFSRIKQIWYNTERTKKRRMEVAFFFAIFNWYIVYYFLYSNQVHDRMKKNTNKLTAAKFFWYLDFSQTEQFSQKLHEKLLRSFKDLLNFGVTQINGKVTVFNFSFFGRFHLFRSQTISPAKFKIFATAFSFLVYNITPESVDGSQCQHTHFFPLASKVFRVSDEWYKQQLIFNKIWQN